MIRSYEKDKRVERAKVIRAIRDKLDRDREKKNQDDGMYRSSAPVLSKNRVC